MVSKLEAGPSDFGSFGLAHAGPLWFSAFGLVRAGEPARLAAQGGPYNGWKVVIHPDPGASGAVQLTGTDCASGTPIRFCYLGCSFENRLRDSTEELVVQTDSHLDYTGNMVFRGPGLVRLTTSRLGSPLGSTVIQVPAEM